MKAPQGPSLKGSAFEYEIGEYHLRLTFEEEDKVHWLYRSAPDGLTGKNAVETVDRLTLRNDIVLVAWKEADGTNVIDVLDLTRMRIFPNFVTAAGDRFSVEAPMIRVS